MCSCCQTEVNCCTVFMSYEQIDAKLRRSVRKIWWVVLPGTAKGQQGSQVPAAVAAVVCLSSRSNLQGPNDLHGGGGGEAVCSWLNFKPKKRRAALYEHSKFT